MWEKIKLWTRVIVFGAMALYVLIVVTLNWGLHIDGELHLVFTRFDHPRVLLVLVVTAVLSIVGWWLFRAIFKTIRQFRTMRERSRTTKLEREIADMRAKAGMLQKKESTTAPNSTSPGGFPVIPNPVPAASGTTSATSPLTGI
ncbi:MAG TPA: hypothetical protein VH475_28225, partial [Tepidisphaeraceae bacterium]